MPYRCTLKVSGPYQVCACARLVGQSRLVFSQVPVRTLCRREALFSESIWILAESRQLVVSELDTPAAFQLPAVDACRFGIKTPLTTSMLCTFRKQINMADTEQLLK